MENKWGKVLSLIKKTGDRCIIFDEEEGNAFVVMDIKEYEKLIFQRSEVRDLTEDELLDKINRDIAIWQTSQGENSTEKEFDLEDKFAMEDEEEDRYYIEPVE